MEHLPNIPTGDLNPYQRVELGTLRCPPFHATLRHESTDLAHLLGAWAAVTEIGREPDDRISYASQDPRQLAVVENVGNTCFEILGAFLQKLSSSPSSTTQTYRACASNRELYGRSSLKGLDFRYLSANKRLRRSPTAHN